MPVRHVYVHVPFCARRCSYCDFSIAVRRDVPADEYVAALRNELTLRPGGEIDTLYLGGGTPSRLGGNGVRRVLELLRSRFSPRPGAEITLEANPEDVTAEAAAAWVDAGVTRISLGAQSFDDGVLQWMHRVHDAATIGHAVAAARAAGVDNLSLDLIFATPATCERDWERDLEQALALQPEHVSLYGLTIEPSTPLARWRDRGVVMEAPETSYEAEYLIAHDSLAACGYDHYEVSNFARPGYRSRHNSAYWSGAPYDAFGPSAHRFNGSSRAWNVAPYAAWVHRLRCGEDPTEAGETLSGEMQEMERIYLDLRTEQGLEIGEGDEAVTASWIDAGWAKRRGQRIALNPLGWLRLDALAGALTDHRSPCNV